MLSRRGNKLEIHCDHPRCAIRLGLGPVFGWVRYSERPPSGWLALGEGRHLCPMHPANTVVTRAA